METKKPSILEPIMNRLVLAKFLFLQGKQQLARKSKLSANLALLNFHDSFEMLIVAIAYYVGVEIKLGKTMAKVIEDINIKKVIQTVGFNDLNESRRRLKHYGKTEELSKIEEYRIFVEKSFTENVTEVFKLSFDEIRISSLIQHSETKEHVMQAEIALEKEIFLMEIAIAFSYVIERMEKAIFKRFGWFGERRFHKHRPRHNETFSDIVNYVNDLSENIDNRFVAVEEFLTLISFNVNIRDYLYFKELTPYIAVSMDGKRVTTFVGPSEYQNEWNLTRENLEFLYNFVIDSSLQVDNNFPKIVSKFDAPRRKFVVSEEVTKIYSATTNLKYELFEAKKGDCFEEAFPVDLDFSNHWFSVNLKEFITKNNIRQDFGYVLRSDVSIE